MSELLSPAATASSTGSDHFRLLLPELEVEISAAEREERAHRHRLGYDRCPNGTLDRPSCKRRGCPFCGPRWARDWQRVLSHNLEARGGAVATIAITGPGADRLPWDLAWCGHRREHRHSGTRGCRVERRALREWCETLSYRWQRYRQAARLATKRELGYAPRLIEVRVWEPQKRGVPHLHLVVPFETGLERLAAWTLLKHLRRLAGEYDFGDVQRRRGRQRKDRGPDLQPLEGHQAARYLSNYLAGRTGKKSSIRENISDPRLPRSLLWLTPKLTRQTLVTMRTLRRARHLWAWADGRCELPIWASWEEAARVAIVFRRVYPRAQPGPLPDDLDVAALLQWARLTDAWQERCRLVPLFYEEEKRRARTATMTKWAFRETAAPVDELAEAA